MSTIRSATVVLAALGLATGCLTEQRFVTPEEGGPWVVTLDADSPVYVSSDDTNLYLVEQRIPVEFQVPADEALARLADVGDISVPWDRLPFLRRNDIEVQVDWTLSNLSEESVNAQVLLNGFNEFHEYNPAVEIVDDELIADFSQWEDNVRLEPGERRSGTVREEELDEVAVDLATVVNGVTNANQIVFFENQHENDTRSQPFIPDVVPALTGVRVGLRAEGRGGSGAAPPLVLEVTVRVRDNRQVLVQGGDEPWTLPTPELFGPIDAAPPMAP